MIGSGDLRTWLDRFSWTAGRLGTDSHTYGWAVAGGHVPDMERLYFEATVNPSAASERVAQSATTDPPWPTADGTVSVVSSSANDDGAPAGTGAWTVRIWWLNSANVEATEDITLDGVNPVNSAANTIRRVNRIRVLTAAPALGKNAGALTVVHSTSVDTFKTVRAGYCENDGCVQTVPAGKCDWITDIHTAWGRWTANENLNWRLYVRTSSTAPWIARVSSGWNMPQLHLDYPVRIGAGSDYQLRVYTSSAQESGMAVFGYRETL